jgi:hypothetical protein
MWKEKMQETHQILFQHSAMVTMAAQVAATMMVAAMATMMMAMIPCTASAAKKNATKPRKKDTIEIDHSSSEN